ncbi:MAG: hypothetical protein V1761_03900 [bacterium]
MVDRRYRFGQKSDAKKRALFVVLIFASTGVIFLHFRDFSREKIQNEGKSHTSLIENNRNDRFRRLIRQNEDFDPALFVHLSRGATERRFAICKIFFAGDGIRIDKTVGGRASPVIHIENSDFLYDRVNGNPVLKNIPQKDVSANEKSAE